MQPSPPFFPTASYPISTPPSTPLSRLLTSQSTRGFRMSLKQMSSALIPGGRKCPRAALQKHVSERTNRWCLGSCNSGARTLGNNKDADKIGVGFFAPSFGNSNKTQIATMYLFVPGDRNFNNFFLGKWKLSLPLLTLVPI